MDLNKLENNTILELREFAKEIGIKSVTRYKKAELIQLIQEKLKEMAEMQQREWLEKKRKQEGLQQEEVQAHDREQETAQRPAVEQERKPARRGRPRKKDVQAGQQEEARAKRRSNYRRLSEIRAAGSAGRHQSKRERRAFACGKGEGIRAGKPELYDEKALGFRMKQRTRASGRQTQEC